MSKTDVVILCVGIFQTLFGFGIGFYAATAVNKGLSEQVREILAKHKDNDDA